MKTHRTFQERMDALPASVYQIIKTGFVTTPKKELKATRIFYVNNSYPEYAKTITYEKYTAEGEAAIVAEGSKNIPLLNDYVEDVTVKVVTIKQGLVITDIEQKALAAGHSYFKTTRVSEIRYQINLKLDKVAFMGDKQSKIPAITGVANANTFNFPADLETKTGFELLEVMRAFKEATNVDDMYEANILLVPKKYWPLFTKAISQYDTTTVMDKMKAEGLFDLIEKLDYLDALDPAGNGKPWFVGIDGAAENLEFAMVQQPQQLSEHLDTADNMQINYGARTAGVMVYHEAAISYGKPQ